MKITDMRAGRPLVGVVLAFVMTMALVAVGADSASGIATGRSASRDAFSAPPDLRDPLAPDLRDPLAQPRQCASFAVYRSRTLGRLNNMRLDESDALDDDDRYMAPTASLRRHTSHGFHVFAIDLGPYLARHAFHRDRHAVHRFMHKRSRLKRWMRKMSWYALETLPNRILGHAIFGRKTAIVRRGRVCSGVGLVRLVMDGGVRRGRPRMFNYVLTVDGVLVVAETATKASSRRLMRDVLSKHLVLSRGARAVLAAGDLVFAPRDDQDVRDTLGLHRRGSVPSRELVLTNNSGSFGPPIANIHRLARMLEKTFVGLHTHVLAYFDPEWRETVERVLGRGRHVRGYERMLTRRVSREAKRQASVMAHDKA